MTTYVALIENTYYVTNAPLYFKVGYVNVKSADYTCLTRMDNDSFEVYPFNGDMKVINSHVLQTGAKGSYSVQIFDLAATDNPPIIYSFYIYKQFFKISQDQLEALINRELPTIYNPQEPLNKADNYASAGVIHAFYAYIYDLYFNSLTSIGAGSDYNSQWEFVYVGATNLLKNAAYPAEFLKTLMRVNTQTSVQAFSLAQCISRLVYQFTGTSAPVSVRYSITEQIYNVNIYYAAYNTAWQLGVEGFSELGVTTVLGSLLANPFLWIINAVIKRLMPAFVPYAINYYNLSSFNADYDVDIVSDDDYIAPGVIYDAYEVVNNNNTFNTRGYMLLLVDYWYLGVPGSSELGITTFLNIPE